MSMNRRRGTVSCTCHCAVDAFSSSPSLSANQPDPCHTIREERKEGIGEKGEERRGEGGNDKTKEE
jgi:hypothetical protein